MSTSLRHQTALWAETHILAYPPGAIPPYGSEAFHALPDPSPQRTASLVVAAELWRRYGSLAQEARVLHWLALERSDTYLSERP